MKGADPRHAQAAGARERTLNLFSPLGLIARREPVTIGPAASVREALLEMDRRGVSAIVVADPERRIPLGIFTLHDLMRRVALGDGDLDAPIAAVLTGGLVTLRPQASAYQAAVVMAQHGVRHLVVVDPEERLVGLVSRNDLFGLQRVGVNEISDAIHAAHDLPALQRAAEEIRRLARALVGQGVATETLTQFVATLNDLLTGRLIELTLDRFDLPPVRMCWIALGSEGRLEQTFSTDQDNGIVFDADDGDAAAIREAFVPFARAVNEGLAACGFPLCAGEVMAGNPRWCLSVDEWRRLFFGWIDGGAPEDLMHAGIFFDLRPIYGHHALAERLRDGVSFAARARPAFLRALAWQAVQHPPPLGRIRDFVFDDSKEFPRSIDLKKAGVRPFVDAARVFGLAAGVRESNTAERLRWTAGDLGFAPEEVAALVDGFYFIQLLRLRQQCREGAGAPGANRVSPEKLNELDRQVLKESFRQARKLLNKLAYEYGVEG